MPKVWNVKDRDIPKGAIYCGRGSSFGNPFRIGRDGTRYEVLAKHLKWIENNPRYLRQIEDELKGKDLICHCAPRPCHCDSLLVIANRNLPEEEF